MALSDRLERVQTYIRQSTWPRGYVSHPAHRGVYRAVADVLVRLPTETFERVEANTAMVFEDGKMNACSVQGQGVIVIFERGLTGGECSIKGLLAHELAHSAMGGDHTEEDADQLALSWGFDEIRELHREGGSHFP